VDVGIQMGEGNNISLSQEVAYTLQHTQIKIIFPILMGKRVWIQLEKTAYN